MGIISFKKGFNILRLIFHGTHYITSHPLKHLQTHDFNMTSKVQSISQSILGTHSDSYELEG